MNVQHVGWMLCWDLVGINVSHEDLVQLAKRHGVASRYLPNKHSFISAYKSAKSNLAARLKKEKLFFSIKPVVDSGDTLCYQLSREVDNSQGKEYAAIAQYQFSRSTGAIDLYRGSAIADTKVACEVLDWLRIEYQKCLNHGTDDFRTLLTNWCSVNAISLRSAGGFYFAPVSCGSDLEKIEKLLASVSTISRLRKVRVLVESQDLAFYQESANNALSNEISQLEKDLEDFTASVSTPSGKRSGTARRLQQYRELKTKVETISQGLGIAADPLVQKLEKLTAMLSGNAPPVKASPAPVVSQEKTPQVSAALLSAIAALTGGNQPI